MIIDSCEGNTTAVKLREIKEHGPYLHVKA
jgi:hypothetical protein